MSANLSSPEPAPVALAPLPTAGHTLALAWARANPLAAALVGAFLATLTVFYAAVPLFTAPDRSLVTPLHWLRGAWNPESHYEHGPLVPLIILFLVWNALPKLCGNVPRPSLVGLVPIFLGIGFYLVGVRALQPRITWGALPFLLWGGVLYTAGWQAARVLLFPIACMFFMIPVPGIDQTTVRMQVMATQAAAAICNLIGIKMVASGVTLRAVDESFQFQVIGDCSGINSLMAITLMTAVFAHLTQDRFWKQVILFASSVPVAIIGNFARLTSIMIVAKCFGQSVAGGWFHEVSAYLISFPFAFGALCLVNKLLNWRSVPRLPGGGTPAVPPPTTRLSPVPSLPNPPATTTNLCLLPSGSHPYPFRPVPTKPLAILLGLVLLGLGLVFVLPHHEGLGPAGIAMVLPDNIGQWTGSDAPITKDELTGLAPDTGFARRFYKNAVGDRMYVSIVLSGTDMANSIHRPERCLVAQGWTPEKSERIRVPLPSGSPLEVTKLTDEREAHLTNDKAIALRNLNYYWFIGSHDITASHWTRTFIDLRDRVLYGENQRWAYVTVATDVTDNLRPGGLNAQDSAQQVERFISQLVPHFHKP